MRKMIAYRMSPDTIERIDIMAKGLRVTKTAVLEYALDYCFANESFLGYALDRREGLEPKVRNTFSDGFR